MRRASEYNDNDDEKGENENSRDAVGLVPNTLAARRQSSSKGGLLLPIPSLERSDDISARPGAYEMRGCASDDIEQNSRSDNSNNNNDNSNNNVAHSPTEDTSSQDNDSSNAQDADSPTFVLAVAQRVDEAAEAEQRRYVQELEHRLDEIQSASTTAPPSPSSCNKKHMRRLLWAVVLVLIVLAVSLSLGIVIPDRNKKDDALNLSNAPSAAPTALILEESEKTCFSSALQLRTAVDQLFQKNRTLTSQIEQQYGLPIGIWCVGKVTDFSDLFSADRNPALATFNQDIGAWDMSSAVSTAAMFLGARQFHQDLKAWDLSQVTTMWSMFQNAANFNGDITTWNTSQVQNMWSMLEGATQFNQDLSRWDTRRVTFMGSLFRHATSFNGNISTWNVSAVDNMWSMLEGATSFNQDLSQWQVHAVDNMWSMFRDATAFNQDLSAWNVTAVESMWSMLKGASAFSQNMCPWGQLLRPSVSTYDMFADTACPVTDNPDWSQDPPGPFCWVCT